MPRRIFDLSKDLQEQMVLYGHSVVMAGARDAALNLPLPCDMPELSRQKYAQMLAAMASVLECTDCILYILYIVLEEGAYPTLLTDLQTLHDLSFDLGQCVGADDENCEAVSQKLIQRVCGDNSDEALNYGKILEVKRMAFLGEAKVREYLARDCRKELTARDMVVAIRGDILSRMQKQDLTTEEKARTRKLAFLEQVPFLWIAQTPLDSLYAELLYRGGDALEALAIENLADTLDDDDDPQIPHVTMDDLWKIWDAS